MKEREADEKMKKRFLKAYKKGLIESLFTYSGKCYIDVGIKDMELLRLKFSNEGEKINFMESEKINCRAIEFPGLGRIGSTPADFMDFYRKRRIGLRDIVRVEEYPDNYAVFFSVLEEHRLPYASLKKARGKDDNFSRLLQLLIQGNAIEYQDNRQNDKRPKPDMYRDW